MCSVLVVEDYAPMAHGLERLLLRTGFDVTVTEDGEQAFAHLQANANHNLILLDLMLPRLSGWHLLDAIVQHERWRRIPVVVLTSAPAALASGACAFLRKPATSEEILAAVVRHCACTRVARDSTPPCRIR